MAEILSRTDFLTDRRLPLRLIRRDPQEEYGLHSHEFSELVIVYRGWGEHLIFGERRPICAGDVFLIKEQTRHGYENLHDLALCNLLFDLHEVNNPLFALCRYPVLRSLFLLEPGFSSRRRGLRLSPEELPEILEILSEIEKEQNGREEDFASAMSAWLVLLTVKLSRLHGTGQEQAQEGSFELYRLLNEISDRSQEEWSRERMAKLAGMSVSTLTRHFRRATGYPPKRISADAALETESASSGESELSISDIADRVGFSDSNYFCRQFKRHYGLPPQKYRNMRV